MNIEKAVVEFTSNINHAGLNEQIVDERLLYLCLIAVILINKVEVNAHHELLKMLFTQTAKTGEFEDLLNNLEKFNFTKRSHHRLYVELIERLKLLDIEKLKKLLNESSHLLTLDAVEGISKINAVQIYSHTAQRFQKMNVQDKLSDDFVYQDIPSCFGELAKKLVNNDKKHTIYDPYALTAELSIYYSINSNVELATTETLVQSSPYIIHMLYIAGVENNDCKDSFGLAQQANIEPAMADVALTLLDPTSSKEDEHLQKLDNEPMFSVADGRIIEDTVPAKFKDHAFIQHLLYSIKEGGTAIIFLGKGPLHREIEKNARAYLLENNLVDAVIELPAKLIKPRTVSLYALILTKGRSNNIIKFIDASNCYNPAGRINEISDLDEIAECYHSKNSDLLQSATIDVDSIIENGCSLLVSSYLTYSNNSPSSVNIERVRSELFAMQNKTDSILKTIEKALKNYRGKIEF